MREVMCVLRDRLYHHQWRFPRDAAKNLHPIFLRIDETVLFRGIIRVSALYSPAAALNRGHHGLFHLLLRRPAFLIGGKAQIAVCDEVDGFLHALILAFVRASGYLEGLEIEAQR